MVCHFQSFIPGFRVAFRQLSIDLRNAQLRGPTCHFGLHAQRIAIRSYGCAATWFRTSCPGSAANSSPRLIEGKPPFIRAV
jgi:hypothetical protein